MIKEETKEETKDVKTSNSNNRCSDFDDDCNKITDHFRCWSGNFETKIGVADGICPFIHSCN